MGRAATGHHPAPATPERRYSVPDRQSPAPSIVVVGAESSQDMLLRGPGSLSTPERLGLGGEGGPPQPPKAGTLTRLRQGPKDTIPIIGKPPRKQRSSRFVPSEKVDIERLPPFSGT